MDIAKQMRQRITVLNKEIAQRRNELFRLTRALRVFRCGKIEETVKNNDADAKEKVVRIVINYGPIKQGEIHRMLNGHVQSSALCTMLSELETSGKIKHTEIHGNGRPSIVWDINSKRKKRA